MDERDKTILDLKHENQLLVRAIDELREQIAAIAGTAAAVRRLPIRDLANANIQRNS